MADVVSRPARVETLAAQPAARVPLRWGRVASYAVLLLGTLVALGPFLWMVSASLMTASEIGAGKLLPATPLWENYPEAWARANMAQYMWNSTRITAIAVVGELLFCVPAAYAFARMTFRGRDLLFGIMLATMMIPAIATLIPNYLTVVWLSRFSESVCGEACRWLDSWPALTVPFMASAFSIFLLRQFFAQIPEELWDAARIDGAGHARFLWAVVLPLSGAPLMTVVTFTFIGSWNALMWPLLVVQSDEWRPVAYGLQKFMNSEATNDLHLQMAGAVMMILPILALYFVAQKQFTQGISTTGLKG